MSVVVMLRPAALAACAALTATALPPGILPASAQQYVPPYGAPTTYGAPYTPAPSMAGARDRRALDNSYRAPAPSRSYEPVRPGIWNGLYIGGNAGYVSGGTTPSGSLDTVDVTGGTFGLHAGYNWQFREWVIGLEGDAAWNNVSGSRTFSGPLWVSAQNDWTATLRARAGYSFSNMLVYATGGLAWGGADVTVNSAGLSTSASEALFGYVVGGGLEVKFNPNISARIEGLHYGFNDHKFQFGGGTLPVDTNVTTVRAGLTFHFN
ncbi:MAG: outer membrane protein [Hyphomicrobiaceae bacterium]